MAVNTTTEEVILDIKLEGEGEAIPSTKELTESIDELTKANKELRKERNALDLSTENGRKLAAKLNDQIDKNTKTIKDNSSALEKQRFNIGNYTGAVDKLVPGLGATANGFLDMTKAAWAFVANPIGATLAAIALLLSPIVSFLKNTGDGMDLVEAKSARLSGAIGVLSEKFNDLGRSMVEAFDSDKPSSGASKWIKTFIVSNPLVLSAIASLEALKLLFPETAAEMAAAADEAERLANQLDAVADAQLEFSITAHEMNQEAKALEIQAKNSTLTERERIDLLKEAEGIRQTVLDTNKKLALDNLQAVAQNESLNKLQQGANEGVLEFAKRVIANQQLTDDQRKAVAEAYQEYLGFIDETQGKLEKNAVEQEKLVAKELENIEKVRLANEKKAKEKLEQDERDRLAREAQLLETSDMLTQVQSLELGIDLNTNEQKAKLKEEQLANLQKQQDNYLKKQQANAKKEEEIEKFKTNALLAMNNKFFSERSVARLAINALLKQDALSQIAIDTKTGAVAAYKSLAGIPFVGPLLGGIAAAAVIAYGLSAAASVAGVKFFGRGGKVGTFRGRSHDQGGEDYVNTRTGHRINVEGDENFYVLKKSASKEINQLSGLNVKHGGRAFGAVPTWRNEQGGQIETRSVSTPGLTTQDIQAVVVATVKNIRIGVSVDDIILGVDNKVSVEETAKVL